MSETTAEQTAEATEASVQTSTETAEPDATEALSDKGKQALDRMKSELSKAKEELAELRAVAGDKRGLDRIRNDARAEVQEKIRELEEFKAKAEGREAEYLAEQEKRATEQAALAKANERILKAEVRAAAAGKLSDPADALRFIDLSSFEVGDDGEVDASAITSAISDLIESKPYLAAQSGKKFQGSADGGTRNGGTQPSQLSKADVERLYAEGRHAEIVQAKAEGRLSDYLAS